MVESIETEESERNFINFLVNQLRISSGDVDKLKNVLDSIEVKALTFIEEISDTYTSYEEKFLNTQAEVSLILENANITAHLDAILSNPNLENLSYGDELPAWITILKSIEDAKQNKLKLRIRYSDFDEDKCLEKSLSLTCITFMFKYLQRIQLLNDENLFHLFSSHNNYDRRRASMSGLWFSPIVDLNVCFYLKNSDIQTEKTGSEIDQSNQCFLKFLRSTDRISIEQGVIRVASFHKSIQVLFRLCYSNSECITSPIDCKNEGTLDAISDLIDFSYCGFLEKLILTKFCSLELVATIDEACKGRSFSSVNKLTARLSIHSHFNVLYLYLKRKLDTKTDIVEGFFGEDKNQVLLREIATIGSDSDDVYGFAQSYFRKNFSACKLNYFYRRGITGRSDPVAKGFSALVDIQSGKLNQIQFASNAQKFFEIFNDGQENALDKTFYRSMALELFNQSRMKNLDLESSSIDLIKKVIDINIQEFQTNKVNEAFESGKVCAPRSMFLTAQTILFIWPDSFERLCEATRLAEQAIYFYPSELSTFSIFIAECLQLQNQIQASVDRIEAAKSQIKVEQYLTKIKEESGSLFGKIDQIEKNAAAAIKEANAAAESVDEARKSSLEMLGFFSGVISFIIGTVQIAKSENSIDSAYLLVLMAGCLLVSFAGFSFMIKGIVRDKVLNENRQIKFRDVFFQTMPILIMFTFGATLMILSFKKGFQK